jgi:hypothetical protein
MKTLEEIQGLTRTAFAGEHGLFRPCAFFDKRLDCIRVIARDCSVLEERINDRLTVLLDNYPGPGRPKYVGFTIKGAKHFCREYGWDLGEPIKMTAVLDAVVAKYPDMVVDLFINHVARQLVHEIDEVEMTAPVAA